MKKTFISVALLGFASVFALGCAVDATGDANAELNAALDRASADESFLATVDLLQAKGVEVDLAAASLERGDGDILTRVSIPLAGEGYQELVYEVDKEARAKVIVKETLPLEATVQTPGDTAGGCGTYLYSNNCSYGPWASGQGCSNGPLYKYDSYTRQHYTNGRKLIYQYTWYSCAWMAQDPSCTSTCW